MSRQETPAPPVQIPGAHTMEPALSGSPDLITPPDNQLEPTVPDGKTTPLPATRISITAPRPSQHVAHPQPSAREFAATLLKYGTLRTTSGFRTSAERQGLPADADTEMSVDDVFSIAADRRTLAREIDDMRSSPQNSDSDDSCVPFSRYSRSLGSSPGMEPALSLSPETRSPLSSSYGSRRSIVRSLTQARSYGSDGVGFSTASRKVPYAVPSRSPVSIGPLSMAMSAGIPMRTSRRPAWATRAPTMTPLQPTRPIYDDDETDEESVDEDTDATEDEDIRPRSPSSFHALAPGTQDMDLGEDERYDGMRSTLSRPGIGARYGMLRHPLSSSMPEQRWGALTGYPWVGRTPPEDAVQVHVAAAALDRLSMAPVRDRAADDAEELATLRERVGGASNCSAFISKLWHLMSHPELYGRYIHWSEGGDMIIMRSEPHIVAEFAANVLPKLFKHGNNASFVRQLNLYGFQRVPSTRLLDNTEIQAITKRGGIDGKHEPVSARHTTATDLYGTHSAFAHPRFRRGEEVWLASMRPRSSKKPKKAPETPG